MVDDAILSRETAYMYQYLTGFQPIGGNLKHWEGIVTDGSGNSGKLKVDIPDQFPAKPPTLTLVGSTSHPRANAEGEIKTRSIQNWQNTNHVFSVVREALAIINTSDFKSAEETDAGSQESNLRKQVSMLEGQLSSKKQEFNKIKNQSRQEVASSHSMTDLIEDTLIEVENEAFALEEAYDNLEVKAIEFAMNFVDARKRYYLIEEAKQNL